MSCIGKTNELANKGHVLTPFTPFTPFTPSLLKRIHLFAGSEPGRDELKEGRRRGYTIPLPWQSLNFRPLPQGQGSLRRGILSFTSGVRAC